MRTRFVTLMALVLIGSAARASQGQDLYITGAAAVNSRAPGWTPSLATPSGSEASNVASVTGGVGVWVRQVGLEGAVSITRAQPIAWHYGYLFGGNADEITYDRDVPLLGLVRVAPLRWRTVSPEPVIGGGVTLHRGATYVTADCGSGSNPKPCVPVTPPRAEEVKNTPEWTLIFGADVAFRASSRVSVAPGFRVSYIGRPVFMTWFDHRGPYSGGGHVWGVGVTARYSIHAQTAPAQRR